MSEEKLTKLLSRRPDLKFAIRERINDAYRHMLKLITSMSAIVDRLAKELPIKRVMTVDEIVALVEEPCSVSSLPNLHLTPALLTFYAQELTTT